MVGAEYVNVTMPMGFINAIVVYESPKNDACYDEHDDQYNGEPPTKPVLRARQFRRRWGRLMGSPLPDALTYCPLNACPTSSPDVANAATSPSGRSRHHTERAAQRRGIGRLVLFAATVLRCAIVPASVTGRIRR